MPDKKTAEHYAGVRVRGGQLNTMLAGPKEKYEQLHPDRRVKWEQLPDKGSNNMVVFREAQGFKIVDAAELNPAEDSAQKSGPIRMGDLVLMSAPKAVFEEILAQDAEAADLDFKTPEIVYKENLRNKQYRLNSGEVREGKPFGEIRRSQVEVPPEAFVETSPKEPGAA